MIYRTRYTTEVKRMIINWSSPFKWTHPKKRDIIVNRDNTHMIESSHRDTMVSQHLQKRYITLGKYVKRGYHTEVNEITINWSSPFKWTHSKKRDIILNRDNNHMIESSHRDVMVSQHLQKRYLTLGKW